MASPHRLEKNDYGIWVPCRRCFRSRNYQGACLDAGVNLGRIAFLLAERDPNFFRLPVGEQWTRIRDQLIKENSHGFSPDGPV